MVFEIWRGRFGTGRVQRALFRFQTNLPKQYFQHKLPFLCYTVRQPGFMRYEMKVRFLAIGGILIAGLIFLLVLASPKSHSLVRRLPDGSWLKIVSVSYGSDKMYQMPPPKPWQSFLLKHLPASCSARLGLWQGWGGVGSPVGWTNLTIFTVCKQATPASLTASPQIDVFDERGGKIGTALHGATSSNSDGKHLRRINSWPLYFDIPQDTKTLVLRFSESAADGTNRQQVAEFAIPNPAIKQK